MTQPDPTKMLSGIKVVEFCQVAAGPFCSMLLADYGAEVIKIEPPTGDSMRQWPPFRGGYSENFASLNRGKRSVVLNLKEPSDLEIARALALDADVLIENNRPGAMQRLGLGWDWFREHKPGLIYCSISAYGQSGPRSSEGGFDVTIQAASGIMSVTGEEEGDPVKCGVPISDFGSGLYAAFSIAAMLASKNPGGHIDVPMFGTSVAIAALQTSEYFGTGNNPKKTGSAHPRNAPYQAFQANDGWFVLAAGNDKLWYSVCEVAGTMELLNDERFTTQKLRAANQVALKELLEPRFQTRDVSTWLTDLQAIGVPSTAINGYAEALEDPQAQHLQLAQQAILPGDHHTRTVGCPVWINGEPVKTRNILPALGENTSELRLAVERKT